MEDLTIQLKVPMSQLFENQYTMPSHQLLQLDGSIRNKVRDIDGVKMLRVDSGDERPSVLNTLTVSVED